MSLDKALLQARKSMVMPTKNCTLSIGGKTYRYADLGAVFDVVMPSLIENGVLLMQYPKFSEGSWSLVTELSHPDSGQTRSFSLAMIISKQDQHGFGSAITYARRYAILGILGLVADDDDDGHVAVGTPVLQPAKITSAVLDARNKVAGMVGLLTTSDAEIMGFIASLSKSDNSLERWEARGSDESALRAAFMLWKSKNAMSTEAS